MTPNKYELKKYVIDGRLEGSAITRDTVLGDYPLTDPILLYERIRTMRKTSWFKELDKNPPPASSKDAPDRVAEIKDALTEGPVFRDAELRVYLNVPLKEWESLRFCDQLNDYRLDVINGPRKGLWWANPKSIAVIRERCDIL